MEDYLETVESRTHIIKALCGDWKHCIILGKERGDAGISLQIRKVPEHIRANDKGTAKDHTKLQTTAGSLCMRVLLLTYSAPGELLLLPEVLSLSPR